MKLLDGQTVGIDLGTTYSSLAQLNSAGDPVSIRDTSGRVTVPSVVYLADADRVTVGPAHDMLLEARPEHIVEAIKRQMGNPKYSVVYNNRKMTPEFVSAMILKKLKQDAEKQIGPIANAVITVPYYFNDLRRKATQDAGRIAGLNVIDIINEPTAATLAYAWIKGELGRVDVKQAERTILVYDLGGGTFDVTVVRYSPTNFRVLATDGDVKLGGLDWSARLVDFVAEKFRAKFGTDPRDDELSKRKLTKECEDAKRELSRRAQVPVTAAHGGKTTTVAVTRGEFENLTADLLQRTRDTTELVLELADVDPRSLDDVVLVGGSTHMPAAEEMLRTVCRRTPSREISPEEAVAQGAAVHAAILEAKLGGMDSRRARALVHRLQTVNTSNVNSHSLGVVVTDPRDLKRKFNHVMVPRNTPIPFRTSQRFATTVPNQQRIDISVVEGESEDPEACVTIGEFQIRNLPGELPVGSPVEVTYEYDASGRIHVSARELVGNNEASARIVRESSLDDEGLRAFETLARDYEVD